MVNVLALDKANGLKFFQYLLESAQVPNAADITVSAKGAIKGYSKALKAIEEKWYTSVNLGTPDYSMYDLDEYMAEVWVCWEIYSKKYLRDIQKIGSLPPSSVYESTQNTGVVVDLGNGLGITTAALTKMYPASRVVGTNVSGSTQYKVATLLSQQHNFEMVTDLKNINAQADIVFAFEYFEHFESPIEHLNEIYTHIKPRQFLIASTFGGDAIGHFDNYKHEGSVIHGKKIGREFNNRLRALGYVNVKTKLWNNRPSYWVLANG